MLGLTDKVILVTGAAQGIGKATALRLSQEGAIVVLADKNTAGVDQLAAEITTKGQPAMALQLDVSSRESWSNCMNEIVQRHGRLAGLVNNAGLSRDKSLLKMNDDDWQIVIDVNLRGAWLGCQLAIPHMKAHGGSIVNLSSESRWGAFGQSNYASAKAGLVGLTRTIALEHAKHGIRVNAVAPGTTTTPMVESVSADIRAQWAKNIPLQREGSPSEIAAAIAFLLSDDASYITGQILGVNGGSAL